MYNTRTAYVEEKEREKAPDGVLILDQVTSELTSSTTFEENGKLHKWANGTSTPAALHKIEASATFLLSSSVRGNNCYIR